MKDLKIIFVLFCCSFTLFAQTSANQIKTTSTNEYPIPYTTKDRDLLLTLNERVNAMQQQIIELKNEVKEVKSELQQQIQDIKSELQDTKSELQEEIRWLMGILISLVVTLIAFILWDRRTFMKPLEKDVEHLKAKMEYIDDHIDTNKNFWKALRELAQSDEKLKQILKQYNLL
jgi:predicted PurR-regulated permease PerM